MSKPNIRDCLCHFPPDCPNCINEYPRRPAMHKNKAIEQLEEADNMLDAGWSKMDSLEWKRWAFIMAVRLMSALVNAVLSIRDEDEYGLAYANECTTNVYLKAALDVAMNENQRLTKLLEESNKQ